MGCQRPKRALFISTLWQKEIMSNLKKCVNALNGLSSFLRRFSRSTCSCHNRCQRPKRALFISTAHCAIYYIINYGVNALNGLSSFLLEKVEEKERENKSVNALNGLSSFLPKLLFNYFKEVVHVSTP